jgi:signal transduction histidine kinase
MLLLVLAGGYWLANRAMRPVQRITHTAQEISATDLSRRINLGTEDELGSLADTFDRMLDRLQAAFDRQRQFTADASHELRTPLTIINLEVDRALEYRRTVPDYVRALSVVQAENELMTRLVNNLLALSRMDAGQAALSLEILDLSDVTLEVMERLTPLAEGRGVQLATGGLPELFVSGDRQYLGQMISNLIENAIKYSRQPDARVWIETGLEENQPAGEPFARIWVKDNGPGISPEHLPHIFDRFYQVDQARSRNTEEGEDALPGGQMLIGSGLGLSIVQWIAHAHGGEVEVGSEVGRGSTFSVRIPLALTGAEPKTLGLAAKKHR